ncbi:hypothetical protein ACQEVG_26480 [Streptomyces sp. CA-135486]|uniref:hypothetical protein n=1 Tax=Streptomyces sp. CA-135486 TaxID=3240049 RepID=UPI003D8C2829
MPELGGDDGSKVEVDQIIELAAKLENVPKGNLRRALKAINYTARTQRLDVYLGHATTAMGNLVAAGIVAAFLWLGYSMVEANEAGYGVLLCGLPTSSVAAIFVVKKLPDFKALAAMARQIQPPQQPVDQVPPARVAPESGMTATEQSGGAVP